MQAWRFFLPPALGFTLRNFLHAGIDKATGKPSRPLQSMAFVAENAQQGNPKDVLLTLDRFATEVRWLMRREWARRGADVLWRRTKLGLRLSETERDALDTWMRDRAATDSAGAAERASG